MAVQCSAAQRMQPAVRDGETRRATRSAIGRPAAATVVRSVRRTESAQGKGEGKGGGRREAMAAGSGWIALTAIRTDRLVAAPRCFSVSLLLFLVRQSLCASSSSCLARARRPSTRLQSWLQRLQHTNREVNIRGGRMTGMRMASGVDAMRACGCCSGGLLTLRRPLHAAHICHVSL